MRFATLILLVVFLPPAAAIANPVKTVGTAVVNPGMTTLELRSGFSFDDKSRNHDGRVQLREMFDHGFNDWYALRLTLVQDDLGQHDLEHDDIQWDNRFQVFERAKDGFDGGFRMSYVFRDGDKKPDLADIRWINQIPFGDDYEFRHHIIIQHQVGENSRSGIMPELRWQVTKQVFQTHRFGFEMFNEFGNVRNGNTFSEQSHDAGIVMVGPLFGKARYQAGYRHGISDAAADHAFKFFIGYDF